MGGVLYENLFVCHHLQTCTKVKWKHSTTTVKLGFSVLVCDSVHRTLFFVCCTCKNSNCIQNNKDEIIEEIFT